MANPPLKLEDRAERNQGQWLKCRQLLGEGFVDDAAGRGVQARIGDSVEPVSELPIQIVEISEDAAKEEVLANVAERPLNLAFGLWPVGTTGLWQITVMLRKFAERAVVDDAAILILADDGCLHPVVENLAGHAANRLERSSMTSKHARHRLTEYEPPPDQLGEAQHHGKEPDDLHLVRRIGKAHPELRKVDLGLLARRVSNRMA